MAVQEDRDDRRAGVRAPVSLLAAMDTPDGEAPVVVIELRARRSIIVTG